MVNRRSLILAAAAGALPAIPWAQGAGDQWPNRAVKIILGFPPGQGSDVAARLYAAELNKAFGQPFVVENRPGAGATLAVRDVARSAPDGYSLLFTSSGPLTVAPHLYTNLGFDPMKDLNVVAIVGRSPLLLLVRADAPFKTVSELVTAATKTEMAYGSGGNGVTNHLAMEMFKMISGAHLLHVPYKGASPALTDLIGGQINVMFETPAAALSHVRSGTLRVLAVSSPQRYSQLPDVPTVAEFYPGFDATAWVAFAVPRGTPDQIGGRLAVELEKTQLDPTMREKLIHSRIEPTPGFTPAAAQSYARQEFDKWGKIIQQAKIKIS